MGNFDNIGKLMHLPLENIASGEPIAESEFIVSAAAEAIIQSGGRNWIPVIVQETSDYNYQVVSNQFVYVAAQQAHLERIWCIVIDSEPKNIEQAKILAREVTPKVNLNTASRDTILAALRYLVAEPGSALKELNVIAATNKIEAADRKSWSNFNPVISLRCGITKGKKLNSLAKVFYVLPPEPLAPAQPLPEVISVKRASREEILSRLCYFKNNKLDGFEAVDTEKAADAIFTASKSKWKSLNPITKLECGIDSAKIKTLKKVFSL
jgi:hypothetical protein